MPEQSRLPLGDEPEYPIQLLPNDGDTRYYGRLYGTTEADQLLGYFLTRIPWKHDEAVIYGKHYITARKVAWFGDENYEYTYSGKTRTALKWTNELLTMKELVEQQTSTQYNACLLNLYADGSQGMAWHHDDEKSLGENSTIASLSFGAERRFDLRHKSSREKISVVLEHGSLLLMTGTTQANWQHQLPKATKISEPRVNLTFRRMLNY